MAEIQARPTAEEIADALAEAVAEIPVSPAVTAQTMLTDMLLAYEGSARALRDRLHECGWSPEVAEGISATVLAQIMQRAVSGAFGQSGGFGA